MAHNRAQTWARPNVRFGSFATKIALRLNQRPRKTLGFETSADRLRAVLQ